MLASRADDLALPSSRHLRPSHGHHYNTLLRAAFFRALVLLVQGVPTQSPHTPLLPAPAQARRPTPFSLDSRSSPSTLCFETR